MRISGFSPLPLFNEPLLMGRGNWKPGQPRIFRNELDGDELSDLKFLLDNLGNRWLPNLIRMKKKLEKKGDDLDHVHPLTFFTGVLNHCYSDFRKLKKRGGIPLNRFIGGAVTSFQDESRLGNIREEHIRIFCQKTGKNFNQVKNYVYSKNWEDFIKWL